MLDNFSEMMLLRKNVVLFKKKIKIKNLTGVSK